jgi:biofilm PGA synthesis N-glycosyltransferase PgaC
MTARIRNNTSWLDALLILTFGAILLLIVHWSGRIILDMAGMVKIAGPLQSIQAVPALYVLFILASAVLMLIGLLTLLYFPLSLSFALSQKESMYGSETPRVSIIVPAYNEGLVLANCVTSILDSDYPNFEVILVDDGSQDETLRIMKEYASDPRVMVIAQENHGKASALNAGMQESDGEVIFFVDADGLFKPDTIRKMLAGFTDERVGAVCGNDEPVNVNRLHIRLLSVQSHVGTGFVRRALARINCLPIVSGNIGAFRRQALAAAIKQFNLILSDFDLPDSLRPFKEGFIGEDLELTWRVHAAGYRVNFAPHAMVRSEVPSTLADLWKQRIRWARGFLKTARLHRRLFFNLKHGAIGLYLPVNYFNMVILPFLQIAVILLLVVLSLAGYTPVVFDLLGFLLWLGLGLALFASLWAICLDHAWHDLKYLYTLILWIPYSLMMNLVMIRAVMLEMSGNRAAWNKVGRTGAVTRN